MSSDRRVRSLWTSLGAYHYANMSPRFPHLRLFPLFSPQLLEVHLYSVLVLLDLSSAFITEDRNVLVKSLKSNVGISDMSLDWLISCLLNRSFSVILGDASTSCASLFCGIPQGSILCPVCHLHVTPRANPV